MMDRLTNIGVKVTNPQFLIINNLCNLCISESPLSQLECFPQVLFVHTRFACPGGIFGTLFWPVLTV